MHSSLLTSLVVFFNFINSNMYDIAIPQLTAPLSLSWGPQVLCESSAEQLYSSFHDQFKLY